MVGLSLVSAAIVVTHLLVVNQYGIFRDEFYYLANGRHLAWGYVEHPPAIGVLAAVAQWFGDSALAIRWMPILGSGLLAWIVGVIARRLGGGGYAQVLSAAMVVTTPHVLFLFHVLSMNFAEVLLWSVAAWLVLVALDGDRAWPWIALGVVTGAGLLTKHSMAVYGLGIFVGLLLGGSRAVLRRPWPWVGGAIAAAMFAPHVWWQVRHDWPIVEFARNAQREKIAEVDAAGFLLELFGMMNIAAAVVLVALGLWFLLGRRERRRHAVLAWAWLVVVAVFISQQSKPYYASPAFPPVMAAGAVMLEAITRGRRAWRAAVTAIMVAGAVVFAPMGLPVLPRDTLVTYLRGLGFTPPSGERHELGALPQHFADMHGWEDLARTISSVYTSLPEPERATARVFARNYGQAGSLEHFASRYPLPRVVSPHNSYWLWGPGPDDGGVVIVIGGRIADLRQAFDEVDEVARTRCDWCMPYENDRPVFVGRGWKVPLSAIWPREKRFI